MARNTGVRWRVDAGAPERSVAFESAVLGSAPVPLLVFDTTRERLVFANRRAEACLGAERNELAESGLSGRVVWEADAAGQPAPGALRAALARAAAGAEVCCELGLHTGHGPIRRVRARFTATFAAGPFVSVVLEEAPSAPPVELAGGAGVGLAELQAAFEDLRRSERERARSKRLGSVGTLAAGVAHEINNPLAYILNNLDFALQRLARGTAPRPDPEALEALKEARDGALRVREVVKELRTFARAGSSDLQVLDVREVVESALTLTRRQIDACARLVVTWSAVGRVRGSRARLVQVFQNLLINACEAIEPGFPESNTISVAARDDGDRLEVVVADTGVGIAPSELDRVFDPFYTTKPVGGGTGLGLSICHDLVEALGGSMHVQSQVGEWTQLTVRLPSGGGEPAPHVEPGARSIWQRAQRLLVVDDDPLVARSVRRLLGAQQRVTIVHDGPSALAELLEDRYDVVLCDVMMPEMDGLSLLEAVREARPEVTRRFVFMTGSVLDVESQQRMHSVGAPCIDKPLDLAELTRALTRVLDAAGPGSGG